MLIELLDKRKKEIFILILLTLFFYRSPFIFINGRFMAEEGEIFFANAYKNNFFYSIIFVDFVSGYLNFWANISGIFSNFFDLKIAPLISNYLSLIPKILIIYFVLYTNFLITKNSWQKILFCSLVFICPQNVPEIWMNSINSQIFFAILAFIILFTEYQNNKINYLNFFLILISGLSGVYSCILTPIFFFKYFIFKKAQDLLNFLTILFCTIVQLLIVFFSKFSGELYQGKLHSINFELISNFFYNVILKVFFGSGLIKFLYISISSNLTVTLLVSFVSVLFLIFFIYTFSKDFLQTLPKDKFILISLIYSFFATSSVVLVGGVSQYVGGRYAALPSFFLLCFVFYSIPILKNKITKFFMIILIIFSIGIGFYEFRPVNKDLVHNHHTLKNLDCINCPDWPTEVKKFKVDNNYYLKIWPYPNKTMKLN